MFATSFSKIASSKAFKLFLGLAWFAFIFYYIGKKFDLEQLKQAYLGMLLPYLFLALLLDLLCLFLKSQAWRNIVHPLTNLSILRAFGYYLVGAMLNHLLPLRGGDLGRSDLLGRNHDIPRLHGYSTVLVEGILAALALVPILLIAVLFFPIQQDLARNFVFFSIATAAIAIFVFWISRKSSHAWLEGFKVFKEKKHLAYAFIFFTLAWAIYLAALKSMMLAMQIKVSFWAAPIVAVFLAASMVIPAPPGRLGVFEGTIVLALAMFDVPKELALSFGLVLHIVQSVPTLLWGSIAGLFLKKPSPLQT